MDSEGLKKLLLSVREGSLGVDAALQTLSAVAPIDRVSAASSPHVTDLGYARVDHDREARQGLPEVVFGERKSVAQLSGIIDALVNAGQAVLVTRCDAEKAEELKAQFPLLRYQSEARVLVSGSLKGKRTLSRPVSVVAAGTSDLAVAEEACETLSFAGQSFERIYDVGVAGIHRLFFALPQIRRASAVICIAGMEGALPSVLGGLVRVPLVAVPSSVGYGASFGGKTALFGMLTGCASGMTVVNIDNGFGAAMAVLRMAEIQGEDA